VGRFTPPSVVAPIRASSSNAVSIRSEWMRRLGIVFVILQNHILSLFYIQIKPGFFSTCREKVQIWGYLSQKFPERTHVCLTPQSMEIYVISKTAKARNSSAAVPVTIPVKEIAGRAWNGPDPPSITFKERQKVRQDTPNHRKLIISRTGMRSAAAVCLDPLHASIH
jgi:hypothetical protein